MKQVYHIGEIGKHKHMHMHGKMHGKGKCMMKAKGKSPYNFKDKVSVKL